jgi:hypothetical protein
MLAQTLLELGCACPTCRANGGEGCETYPDGKIPAGTVLDWPDCWKLVRAGAAESIDEECEAAANMTPRQLELAQRAQRRAAAGIHPDDFEAFDSGEMDGYYPDGTFIPGPNASHFRDDDEEGGLWLP